jgi:hypothetical protein
MLRRTRRSLHITRVVPPLAAHVSLHTGDLMKTQTFDVKAAATAFAFVIPISLVLWLLAAPTKMSLATFAIVITVMLAGSIIALMTWSNGRATRSIAHVLNDVEKGVSRE